MKTLILDNFDSFTHNLYQVVGMLGGNPTVLRNTAITKKDADAENFTHIILSPGPGNPYTPRDIGVSEELLTLACEKNIPLLGVCLGHQTIGKYFGATVKRSPEARHGMGSTIRIEGHSPLFRTLGQTIEVMRYHSLCVTDLPPLLRSIAMTDDGVLMAMEHVTLPLYGVQFHPESIGTPDGMTILKNFLTLS